MQFSLRSLLMGITLFAGATAVVKEPVTAFIGELSGESPRDIPDLQNMIIAFNEARDGGNRTPSKDLTDFSDIVVKAVEIAKKRGENPSDTLRRAGQNPEHFRKTACDILVSIRKELQNEKEPASNGHPMLDMPAYHWRATYIPMGIAERIGHFLGFSLDDAGITEQEKEKILVLGMQRCLRSLKPNGLPFKESENYRSLAGDVALSIRGDGNKRPEDTVKQIPAFLQRHRLSLDPASASQLPHDVFVLLHEFSVQYPQGNNDPNRDQPSQR